MDFESGETDKAEGGALGALLARALLLDLEVSHQGNILKVGAVLGDVALARSGSVSVAGIFKELDRLAEKAECLLGHNLVRFDLPVLREHASKLAHSPAPRHRYAGAFANLLPGESLPSAGQRITS